MRDAIIKHCQHPNEAMETPAALDVRGITKEMKLLRQRMPSLRYGAGRGKRTPLMEAILRMRGQLLTQ